MRLLRWMVAQHRVPLLLAALLSALSATLSVGVIAFVNERLIQHAGVSALVLGQLLGLLLALFVVSSSSQVVMSRLGHRLVYALRASFVKRILDTDVERLERLGAARLLTSLSSDTSQLSTAFIALPAATYGLSVCLGAFGYLCWLSAPLFGVTLLWVAFTVAVAWQLLTRTHREVESARAVEDALYEDYQDVIEGRKELTLNRSRARAVYEQAFLPHALEVRARSLRADLWACLNDNWVNCMALGAIGLTFGMNHAFALADAATATTFALTILYLGAPLASVVASVPGLLAGSVALAKIEALELSPQAIDFEHGSHPARADFRSLSLQNVSYTYPSRDGAEGFQVGPLDLTITRGELVFIVGGNGAGKSTLARLLTGLYRPHRGEVRVDGQRVDERGRARLHALFATVLSDFRLFGQLLGPEGSASAAAVSDWLERLRIADKVEVDGALVRDPKLSQGQRKRLALVLALLEERPILLLDEWAADQDPSFRRLFYRELLPALREAGRTVVAITHDDAYFDVADRVLRLSEGRLEPLSDTRPRGAHLHAALDRTP